MRKKDIVRMREAQKDSWDMTVFACEEYELMQVEVKKSRGLKQCVSQNISSNSWNSRVNKVGVLAQLIYIQPGFVVFI